MLESDAGDRSGVESGDAAGAVGVAEEGPAVDADLGLLSGAETPGERSGMRDLSVGVSARRAGPGPAQMQPQIPRCLHRPVACGAVIVPDVPPMLVRRAPEELGLRRGEPDRPGPGAINFGTIRTRRFGD